MSNRSGTIAGQVHFKFDNFLNFQGFPHIPGEDWLTSYPQSSDLNEGGSLTGGDYGSLHDIIFDNGSGGDT
ncbi:MAG: hypothetical protein ACJAYH_002126 [Celeribacter sp.]|jgi:hypothetical protein